MESAFEFPAGWEDLSPRSPLRLDPDLVRRYRDYRRREARALLPLLPREAIRPLYAAAREWAKGEGRRPEEDPLGVLADFAERLLPLPPFSHWLRDREAYLEAHLQEEFEVPAREGPPRAVPVEVQGFELAGRRWLAALHVLRKDGAWRGYIAFRPPEGGEEIRTGDIFREEDPREIRARFLSFQPATLQAFLRSALP